MLSTHNDASDYLVEVVVVVVVQLLLFQLVEEEQLVPTEFEVIPHRRVPFYLFLSHIVSMK